MKSLIKSFNFLGLVVVIVIASALSAQFVYFNEKLVDETRMVTTLSRDKMRSEITGILLRKGQIISDAAEYVKLQKWKAEDLGEYFKLLREKDKSFSLIYLGTPENELINGSGWVPSKDFDLRTRPWYQKALEERGLVFTEAFTDAVRGELIITIAEPVYNSRGELLGVIAGDVSISSIISIVEEKNSEDGSYSFLIDGKENILAHPLYRYDSVDDLKNIYDMSEKADSAVRQSENGINEMILDGEEGYLAHSSIENTDWKIARFTSLDNYMKTGVQYTRIFIVTLLYSIVALVILYMIQKKRLVGPLESVDRDIREINLEKDITYRLDENKDDPFLILRRSINAILNKTQDFFSQLEAHEEELIAANLELEESVHQLAAAEEELWNKNTSLMASETNLKASEEKYKTLITQMHQGVALFEMIFGESGEAVNYRFLEINEGYERITGMKREDVLGKTVLELHPDPEDWWVKRFGEVVKNGEPISFESYSEEYGKYFEIVAYRTKPMHFAMIITDITERRNAEEEVRLSEETFRMIFEGSSDAILIMKDYEYIDCNPVTLQMFGFDSKESVIGKSPWELSPELQPDGRPSREKAMEMIGEGFNNEKHRFEWWHQKKDGSLLPAEVMLTPIVLHGIKVLHVLWRDISERKQLEQKLEYLSYHDQLTGLYNRRFFVEELKRLDVKRNYPLTILMADVNGLKLINDSFGHDRGDELLIKTSEAIKKGCREDDIVSRIGGDEFIILLPGTDGVAAEKIVNRIQDICSKEKVASIEISMSFGWESKLNEEQDISEVLKKAEDYLYKRKLFESPSMRGKTVNAIIRTLHEKNKREEEHSHRVSVICNSMGKTLGLPERDVQELKTMGLLHDIGKIAIDENILNKPGRLTDEEYEEIKKHPEIGYRILSSVNDMSEMAEYVLAHHERWDGGGYPRGLKETEIPLQSRIIAIADAYDAMISARPYRNSIAPVIAIQELRKNAGTQFDPDLVEKFIETLE